jgi:protein phosphatase 1G
MISALPDIKKLQITADDEFMVLACDGIWNFMTSDEVVAFVKKQLEMDKTLPMSKICEKVRNLWLS